MGFMGYQLQENDSVDEILNEINTLQLIILPESGKVFIYDPDREEEQKIPFWEYLNSFDKMTEFKEYQNLFDQFTTIKYTVDKDE